MLVPSGVEDGAWGLRFPSLAGAAHVLVDAPEWSPVKLDITYLVAPAADTSSQWHGQGMRVGLPTGGLVEIVWPFEVTLHLPDHPVPECVVQPHLTTAAAAISLRRGLQSFHAGAFEINGGVWAVLGSREAGKSSTLALAHRRGAPIVTDDLLVIDHGVALAGPRIIDLRAEAARVLEVGDELGFVGRRERWRVRVGPCGPAVPVAGFILPSWGDDRVEDLPPVRRLQVLGSHSALQGVTINEPKEYLRLASLPMISWARPKSWAAARHSFDLLIRDVERRDHGS